MYLGKRKILNPEKENKIREEIISTKSGALWNAFIELEGLINKSQLSKQYFGKTHGWFSQRLHGCTVQKKEQSFKGDEYNEIASAFRDIAKRLQAHADEIDKAEDD